MEGSSLGPYRLLSELGSGGMGTVYLAEVTEDDFGLSRGDKVAVKVVHAHLIARRGFFKRFLREAEIGRRIRHENVVPTLDMDATEVGGNSVLYLVMEHVEGRTLRELLQDLGTVPDGLIREISAQVAAGLSAIHAEGIVHRDLKPENVLITADHQVRIMDLGVARLVEESVALTRDGEFAGSLPYAAPEQFRGSEVTPSADLYALGVMLYELATGSNPFLKESHAEVIAAHLHLVPAPPRVENPEISRFLSQVIVCLLRKSAEERIESAAELVRRIEEAERSDWWAERELILGPAEIVSVVSVRREAALHGRETELEVLREGWRAARDGEGSTIFLEGEAGIGKTRLVDEFMQGIDRRKAHVLYGSYPPSGGIGGISEALISNFGSNTLEQALRPYLDMTPALVPAFAAMVKHEGPPDGGAPIDAEALHTLMCRLMQGLAAEQPLLWILDDLHFAERDSRKIVLSLSRATERSRVLLLITARPGLPEDELAHFSRAGRFRRLPLGRLSPRQVIELVRDVLKSKRLAERLAGAIAYKSDGVPFFVLGLIEELKRGGFLMERPDGTYEQSELIEDIQVPSAVRDLIQARLGGLSEEERAILDVGAVHGYRFDPDLVARVRDMKRVVVLEKLAVLERRSGIVRGEGANCRFDHHQIQELLYLDLMAGLRSEYHALLADAFAEREKVEEKGREELPGESAYFLAFHHLQGSRPEDAAEYLIPALDHLKSVYRREAALTLARRALDIDGLLRGAAREEVLLREAGTLDMLGRREEERESIEEALTLADESGDPVRRARVRRGLGWQLLCVSKPEQARPWLEESLEFARRGGDRKAEATATGTLGTVCMDLSRFEEAREHFERQLDIARRIGDRVEETTATGNLGIISKFRGRYDEARRYYARSIAIARESKDRRAEATCTANLGILLRELGQHEEAREHYRSALSIFRELGYRRGEAAITGNLGIGAKALGRYDEARESFRDQMALAREIGNPLMEGVALLNTGDLERDLGAPESALPATERAREVFREAGDRRAESYTIHGLGAIAEGRGAGGEAEGFFVEALSLRREICFPQGVMESLSALGRLHAREGRHGEARTALDEARNLAEDLHVAEGIVLTTARLALLPGGDAKAAVECLLEHEPRLKHATRMEARYLVWRLTKDPEHLREARRLLDHLREHAPEERRESILTRVPLHRAIVGAEDRSTA